MRKLGLWGGCTLLLLALGLAAASAAPPPADDDDSGGRPAAGPDPAARPRDGWNPFLTRLFGLDDKKPAPRPPEKKDKEKEKDADDKDDAPAPRPSTQAESAARSLALEKAKLSRRQAVCERLREIARETQNEDLERKALQLDARAFEVYLERTQRLPGGESEAEAVEQRPPAPGRRTGTTDSGSTAGVREVKP